MKKMIIALFAVMILVPSLALAWGENNIGLYTVTTPTGNDAEASLFAAGPGGHVIYMVLSNPWNENQARAITQLSGFECSMTELPPGWSFGYISLPTGVLDFHSGDYDFFCSGNFPPADGNDIVLVEMQIGTFDAAPSGGPIFLTPNFIAPSIPDAMAVTDGDDGNSLSRAYPSSGDFGMPVFGINMAVVDSEETSWGSVKSMFK